jgi:hypothetical protein
VSSVLKFREIVLSWAGEEYRVTPNFELIEKIEEAGISLAKLANQCATDNIPFTRVARVVSMLLNHAGCKAGHEEVYSAIYGTDAEAHIFARQTVNAMLMACFPERPEDTNKKKESNKKIKS